MSQQPYLCPPDVVELSVSLLLVARSIMLNCRMLVWTITHFMEMLSIYSTFHTQNIILPHYICCFTLSRTVIVPKLHQLPRGTAGTALSHYSCIDLKKFRSFLLFGK